MSRRGLPGAGVNWRGLAAAGVLLASGCSLPLSSGVHPLDGPPAVQQPGGVLQVIPPGPESDASPTATVLGFLGAEASSDGHHAIARQFLTSEARRTWRDDEKVEVYDPADLRVSQVAGGSARATTVRVTAKVTALVRSDGSYVVLPGSRVVEEYPLVRRGLQWQISDAPAGLRLTAADRARLFAPQSLYYLAPAGPGDSPHVVPDQVFLPVGGDLARTLLSRLLLAPSRDLVGSVSSALPPHATLRRVTQTPSGVITVDLGARVGTLPAVASQSLSAQLVWTLRGLGTSFRGLRLLLNGVPLPVPGEGAVQDPNDWNPYDAEGVTSTAPYFFVSQGRLKASIDLPVGPATSVEPGDPRAVLVDSVAVTTNRATVALLHHLPGGSVTVRVGSLRGTAYPVVARGPDLRSPSWGSDQTGLWLLRGDREVVRVDNGVHTVAVRGLPAGHLDGLAVSRDGVRVALLVGGRLYVGRVRLVHGAPAVVGLTSVLPALHQAKQVVWESGTELVVLGVLTRSTQVVRTAVDGSSSETLSTAGLAPSAIAASPGSVLVISRSRLYVLTSGIFRQVESDEASSPVFPG